MWAEEALRRWQVGRGGVHRGDGEQDMDVETAREKVVKQILPALLASLELYKLYIGH